MIPAQKETGPLLMIAKVTYDTIQSKVLKAVIDQALSTCERIYFECSEVLCQDKFNNLRKSLVTIVKLHLKSLMVKINDVYCR